MYVYEKQLVKIGTGDIILILKIKHHKYCYYRIQHRDTETPRLYRYSR